MLVSTGPRGSDNTDRHDSLRPALSNHEYEKAIQTLHFQIGPGNDMKMWNANRPWFSTTFWNHAENPIHQALDLNLCIRIWNVPWLRSWPIRLLCPTVPAVSFAPPCRASSTGNDWKCIHIIREPHQYWHKSFILLWKLWGNQHHRARGTTGTLLENGIPSFWLTNHNHNTAT